MAEKMSHQTLPVSAVPVTTRERAVDEGGEAAWREFLIELIEDALKFSDRDHNAVGIILREASERFPDDHRVKALVEKIRAQGAH